MKNVTLKITGKHVYENVEEDQMELVTEGKLDKKGDTLYLTYEESEFSGTPGCRTELILTQDVISMTNESVRRPRSQVTGASLRRAYWSLHRPRAGPQSARHRFPDKLNKHRMALLLRHFRNSAI